MQCTKSAFDLGEQLKSPAYEPPFPLWNIVKGSAAFESVMGRTTFRDFVSDRRLVAQGGITGPVVTVHHRAIRVPAR